jgi:hypothetical protein
MAQAQTNPRQGQAGAHVAPQTGQGEVYERLTPREQMIADAETAKISGQRRETERPGYFRRQVDKITR